MPQRPSPTGNAASGKKRPSSDVRCPALGVGYFIKTAVCVLAFLGAMAAFCFVCKTPADRYLLLLMPSREATLPWFAWFGVTILLVAVFAGVAAVLVRPFWVALLMMIAAAALYPLILGLNTATLVSAGVFALLMIAFLAFVSRQLKNQIHFSAHPLSDMKLLLLSLLLALVCVAFGSGYAADAARRNYVIPPEIRAPLTDAVFGFYKSTIESQAKQQNAKPAQVTAAMDSARQQALKMADDAEKSIQPAKPFIPAALGVLLFLFLQSVFLILGFVPILIAGLVLWLLRLTKFARTEVETREVTHLTLT